MKKLIIVLFVLPVICVAQTRQLKSYSELMEALKTGNTVQAVFHYKDCMLISDNEISKDSIDAIGGMKIDTWEFFEKGCIRNKQAFVVSSSSKLIANPKGNGYVYNYVKVKVKDDGEVIITAEYVCSITKEQRMTEKFFTQLNNGNKGSAYFYINK